MQDATQTRLIEYYFLREDGSTNICEYMYIHIHKKILARPKQLNWNEFNMLWSSVNECSAAQVNAHFLTSRNKKNVSYIYTYRISADRTDRCLI